MALLRNACYRPGNICGVFLIPKNCTGATIDFAVPNPTNDPTVGVTDPTSKTIWDAGERVLGLVCQWKTLTITPTVSDDTEIGDPSRCDYVKFSGEARGHDVEIERGGIWSTALDLIDGSSNLVFDAAGNLTAVIPRETYSSCGCASGACKPTFAMLVGRQLLNSGSVNPGPVLDPATGLPVFEWEFMPNVSLNRADEVKVRDKADLDQTPTQTGSLSNVPADDPLRKLVWPDGTPVLDPAGVSASGAPLDGQANLGSLAKVFSSVSPADLGLDSCAAACPTWVSGPLAKNAGPVKGAVKRDIAAV